MRWLMVAAAVGLSSWRVVLAIALAVAVALPVTPALAQSGPTCRVGCPCGNACIDCSNTCRVGGGTASRPGGSSGDGGLLVIAIVAAIASVVVVAAFTAALLYFGESVVVESLEAEREADRERQRGEIQMELRRLRGQTPPADPTVEVVKSIGADGRRRYAARAAVERSSAALTSTSVQMAVDTGPGARPEVVMSFQWLSGYGPKPGACAVTLSDADGVVDTITADVVEVDADTHEISPAFSLARMEEPFVEPVFLNVCGHHVYFESSAELRALYDLATTGGGR